MVSQPRATPPLTGGTVGSRLTLSLETGCFIRLSSCLFSFSLTWPLSGTVSFPLSSCWKIPISCSVTRTETFCFLFWCYSPPSQEHPSHPWPLQLHSQLCSSVRNERVKWLHYFPISTILFVCFSDLSISTCKFFNCSAILPNFFFEMEHTKQKKSKKITSGTKWGISEG